ncbi:cysteine desulfurase family protein [Saccharomonospora viridis]|jgi:cysteine desulfurase|uniref:Cysteine desulfurase family protein n=2 Tax=Saccharomonospora viridis TaxID=1852 RepID=C7MXB3_SACVD|nr:cysteine desulfurase family protein [Saccharomonospora viridis]ACU95922.1 cysteine desulfurase family protein [Saccharomonospora viridis DSM 43017]KHF45583.1 cysteine desulfarase [Saccharomonospora viridis]SFP73527.1 cysteine desulfurase [Saccharomonospora viridis]
MTYLDHAATTPMVPEALEAMTEALSTLGNASSLHSSGRRARRVVEEARESVAEATGARPSEVIFTAGGTESNNLAVKGMFWARRRSDPRRRRVLAGSVEHHAVLDAVQWLADHEGAEVTWLQVDQHGQVRPEVLRAAIEENPDDVALATVMWANNEVGTINPLPELAAVCAEYDIPVHTDAVQAIGAVDVDFGSSGAGALALTGHKLGGPYGAGVLLLGRDTPCVPLLHGGGQERDVRSGTLDVPSIHALATAVRISVQRRREHVERLTKLRNDLVAAVRAEVPDVVLNGPPQDSDDRLPGIAHLTFPGCAGDSLLMLLDAKGIECSTGSACTAGVAEPSHVLLAMGADAASARSSLRFSLGHTSTQADIDALAAEIGGVVARARQAGLSGMRKSRTE